MSPQNYRLQTEETRAKEVSVCRRRSQINYLFIPFLFVHVAVVQTLLSRIISSHRRNSVTSQFYRTFILFHSFITCSSAGAKIIFKTQFLTREKSTLHCT